MREWRQEEDAAGRGAPERVAIRASDLPLAAGDDPVALALIRRTEGPSYRPPGACLVLHRDGRVAGNLSSGCIDADIVHHAREVAASGEARRLRYGAGSPFRDLVLPCGGGLDILVLPPGAPEALARLTGALAGRRAVEVHVSARGLALAPGAETELCLHVRPDPRFVVFGKGPEAVAFTRMTAGAGYDTWLLSPDDETLARAAGSGARLGPLAGGEGLLDRDTAVALFFHDHEREPEILCRVLESPAFYIGAQGSRRAAESRRARLRALGLNEAEIARVRGPIGVIPSTRDPRTLAASVLAEVLAEAVGPEG